MAIKAEDLVVNIKVEGGDAATKISALEKELKSLQATVQKNSGAFGGFKSDAQDASSGFSAFADGIKNSLGGIGQFAAQFSIVNLGIAAFVQNISMVKGALDDVLKKFEDDTDATTRFNFALQQVSGKGTAGLTDEVTKLSKQMQALGIAEDDQVVSLSAVAVAAGATTAQITGIIKAAAGISTIKPNVSFAEAFNALQLSLKGNIRGVSLLAPELTDLTAKSAKAGDAIAYLNEKYGGFAQKNLELYSGKTAAVKFAFGDLSEATGGLISKLVDLPAGLDRSAAAFKSIVNAIEKTGDVLAKVDFKALALEIVGLTAAYIAFNVSLESAALGQAVNLMLKFRTAIITAAAPLAEFALAAAGIVAIGLAIEVAVKNFGTLGEVIKDVGGLIGDAFVIGINKAGEAIVGLKQTVADGFEYIANLAGKSIPGYDEMTKKNADIIKGLQSVSATAKMSIAQNVDDIQKRMSNLDLGNLGVIAETLGETFSGAGDEVYKFGEKANAARTKVELLGEDAKKAMEEIKSKLKEAEKAAASAGLEGISKISSEAKQAQKEITKLGDEIKKGNKGVIPKEALDNMAKLRSLSKQAFDQQIVEAFTKSADELYKESLAGQVALSNEYDVTVDKIQTQLNVQLKLIDLKRQELDRQKLLTGEAEDYLKAQEDVAKAVAKSNTAKAPGKEYDKAVKGGQNFMNEISKTFTEGAAGMVTGALSVAGAFADAIQALIDFIPGLLDKFTKIFSSLTDLPKRLSEALGNLFDAAANFAEHIGENLEKFIPKIIVDIVEKLPDIMIRLWRALIWDIPKAIVKGIYDAFAKILKDFGNFLSGKMPKLKIDEKSAGNLIKNLTGVSANIFSVEDIGKKTGHVAEDIANRIKDAARTAGKWLKDAWTWINDKIIQPIFGVISRAWTWVNDTIIQPIFNVITSAWSWVNDKIIGPIAGAITGAWSWVNEKIIQPIGNMFSSIFSGVKAIFQPILDGFSSIFNGVGNIFSGITEGFRTVFKAILNPFIDLFNALKVPDINLIDTKILGQKVKLTLPGFDLIPGDIKRLASGGMVTDAMQSMGFTPTGTDTVPAMLSPGEFIVSRKGVDSIGINNLRSINKGQMPQAGGNHTYNISVNVDAKTTVDPAYVKSTLIPAVQDGILRASQDGKFVISSRGIR